MLSFHWSKMAQAQLTGRALHYVFKIPDRKETMRFYRNVLGMKVQRHEEFAEGCEATCNGITVKSKEALERAQKENWPILPENKLEAPGGYIFQVIDEDQPTDSGEAVTRGKAYGRIAFSCLHDEQPPLSELIEQKEQTILTPLISLPTPGKADVRVIILADPDGHEICFVDDESYRELSQPDPESEDVLELHMKKDTS
ncbi:unnamed protein product [Callosobruchus maculatus]|uniref:VOC domain-containing protein n=1 Tax=Callosobruchus maculatus TaxID=64391 RepID=A0A653CNW8_CALMS|nr:unnamed protein product [Callosobruchus maculatus]